LPCARTRRAAKTISLPCVLLWRTAKYFLKIEFRTSFYFSTTKTLFCTLYFNFICVPIILLFLTIMCHLKNFCLNFICVPIILLFLTIMCHLKNFCRICQI
jgi:hypothetical protein